MLLLLLLLLLHLHEHLLLLLLLLLRQTALLKLILHRRRWHPVLTSHPLRREGGGTHHP